jgi:hypothetical protein
MKTTAINNIARFISEYKLDEVKTNKEKKEDNYWLSVTRIGFNELNTHFKLSLNSLFDSDRTVRFTKYYYWDSALETMKKDVQYALDCLEVASDITSREVSTDDDKEMFEVIMKTAGADKFPIRYRTTELINGILVKLYAKFNTLDEISLLKKYKCLNQEVAEDVLTMMKTVNDIIEHLTTTEEL